MALEKKKKKSEEGRSPEVPKLSKKRLWLFRVVAVVVIPLVFFAGLEFVLRLGGVGYPTGAVIERKVDGKTVCDSNLKFGWRFFPHNIAREFSGFVFDAKKQQGTYRIFVLGASAALGAPEPAYNFGRILEVMLNERYPKTKFEVITAAMVAINSHAVLEIAKDCAKYEPDLFIVYLGNNEVVGPFGPGTVFSSKTPSLSFIRANIALKSTRIGQLMEKILGLAARGDSGPKRWDGLAMFLEKQVRYDSPDLATVYNYFETNLNDICRVARRAGADVIISSVGCNLKDSPPFASLHKESLSEAEKEKWEQVYQRGIEYETAGEYEQTIENYIAAAEIDETFAELQFRLGRSYWKSGEYEQAREHYIKARRYDSLRFRADERINEVIRWAAEDKTKEGIYFVDSVAAMEENSPHHTPGEELFYEHVHLNFSGNYVLARAIFERMQEFLPAESQQQPAEVLTEEQCAERLTYTAVDRYHILSQIEGMIGKAPFTNQLYHEESVARIRREIEPLREYLRRPKFQEVMEQYKQAVREDPNDWQLLWRYAVVLNSSEDIKYFGPFEIQMRNVIKLCPYNAAAYLALGRSFRQQGNFYEAQRILYQLLKLKPNSAHGHFELAEIYQALGDYKKRIQHLSASMSIESALSINLHVALAEAYYRCGETDKAMQIVSEAIENFPEEKTARGHAFLSYLLGSKGEYKEALEESRLALKIDPNCAHEKGFQKFMNFLETKVKP